MIWCLRVKDADGSQAGGVTWPFDRLIECTKTASRSHKFFFIIIIIIFLTNKLCLNPKMKSVYLTKTSDGVDYLKIPHRNSN